MIHTNRSVEFLPIQTHGNSLQNVMTDDEYRSRKVALITGTDNRKKWGTVPRLETTWTHILMRQDEIRPETPT